MTCLTRRQFLGLSMGVLSLALLPGEGLAFERLEHDHIFEEAIFGQAGKRFKDTTREDARRALESACALCLDQMEGSGADDLQWLGKSYKVLDVPSMEEIDLCGFGWKGYHEQYTHMGWHYDYSDIGSIGSMDEPWENRWQRRKRLLQDTVNKVFDFGFLEEAQTGLLPFYDGTRCDAFAELTYYIHVLGDYQDKVQDNLEKGAYGKELLAIPFGVKDASDGNRDLFYDLSESLGRLFDDSLSGYQKLKDEIDTIAADARAIGEVRTKTKAERQRKCILKLRRTLRQNLPGLLEQTDFFRGVFYKPS